MSYGTNSSSFYRPPVETKRRPTYEELFGVPSPLEQYQTKQRIEKRKRKEQEEAARIGRSAARGREILEETVGIPQGKYRTINEYSLLNKEDIDSFETAKSRADEAYMQYWYSKANGILNGWTDADYALLAEPQYETYETGDKWGSTEERRVLPKSYDRLLDIQKMIEKGPLDFSSKETHEMLIKPSGPRGYGKYQEWIDKSDPLRQAVERQADVMKDYLDKEGISIVTEFEDGNPDNIYGEGVYLNTGTAAHIDWDSELKRMQRYVTTPDSELGTYSQVFYRPEKQGIFDNPIVDVIAGITGMTVPLGIVRRDNPEDIIKGAVLKEIIPADTLENTFAEVGITNETVNDLLGSDIGSTAWSEGLANVTTTGLEGGNVGDAFLGEFGGDLATPVVGGALDAIPDIDIPDAVTGLVQNIETVAQPVINAINTTTEAVENVIDTAIVEPIDKLTQALVPDDVSLDEAVPSVEAVAEIEETPVEPEETPVEPEETPEQPADTTIVEKAASKVGLDAETVSNILDVPTDEVTKVFEDTTNALFAGESGKDALLEGLGGSALEELGEGAENLLGGAVDFVETILPLDPLENVVGAGVELADAVIGAVGDSELVNAIEEGGKALGDLGQSAIDAVVDSDIVQAVGEAGQKAIDVGSDILSEGEDIIRAGGRAVDEAIIQPALGAVEEGVEAVSNVTSEIEDVVSDIASEGEDIIRAGGRAVDEAIIQPVVKTVDQLVRNIPEPPEIDIDLPEFTGLDIEIPEFEAPDIDLPEIDIDLPSIDVDIPTPSFDPRLLAGLMAMPQQQQPTQVEGLFDKELFKFDTEIKSTQEMLSPFMNLRRYG